MENLTRNIVKSNSDTLYIFTDNTDRSSGRTEITSGWYKEKYGKDKHIFYPFVTTAQLRGLDNAFPISTQHYYHGCYKGVNGRWNEEDYDTFVSVLDEEVKDINDVLESGKYKEVVFCSKFVEGKISNITLERTPKLYKKILLYISEIIEKCDELNVKYKFL